jgi:hypothetical protein
MKFISILTALLLSNAALFAQVEAAQIGAEFKDFSQNAGPGARDLGMHTEGIQTYSSGTVKGSQFFYPSWASGTVTTIKNEVISTNYSFLYDKVRQFLFIKWKDSSAVILADKDQVTGFTLNTDKVHSFVSALKYDSSNKTDFFEILASEDKGYTLLKLIKSKFVKADVTDIQRMKDGENYDEFVDEISYYISYNRGIPQKITSEKSIEKAFPLIKQKVTDYYNQNSNDNDNEVFLTRLVQLLNN